MISDTYQLRLLLDPFAASLATTHASPEQRAEIAAFAGGAPPGLTALERLHFNRNLHRAIYSSCGNDILIQMLEHLWDSTDRYRLAVLKHDEVSVRIDAEHTTIIDAILNGDPETVAVLMRDHVQSSRDSCHT